jgi:hypothetical protein
VELYASSWGTQENSAEKAILWLEIGKLISGRLLSLRKVRIEGYVPSAILIAVAPNLPSVRCS